MEGINSKLWRGLQLGSSPHNLGNCVMLGKIIKFLQSTLLNYHTLWGVGGGVVTPMYIVLALEVVQHCVLFVSPT